MIEAIERITQAKNEYDEMVRNAAGSVQDAIIEAFKELPEDVLMFSWSQYTPYFNDGDACVFGVNTPVIATPKTLHENDFKTVQEAFDDGWSHYDFFELYSWRNRDNQGEADDAGLSLEDYEKALELSSFIQQCDDLMHAAFGDHAQITIQRATDGIKFTVDEYDHD